MRERENIWGDRGEREWGARERGSGARIVRESVARGVREWGKMV